MRASTPSIELEGFGFRYHGASGPALEDVSLRVMPGECVVLTGRSGCGKTTLTRAINGLIPLAYRGRQAGRVLIGGTPLQEFSSSALSARVGSVFQNPRSQFVNSEVMAELAFACENQGVPRDEMVSRIWRAATELGMATLLGRKADELSGGQRQLVMLAAAHAAQAEVYVLDEPTAALDATSVRLLARALERLKAQGRTLVISEHRLWWLRQLADRIVRIEGGRIAGEWSSEDFARIPYHVRAGWGLRAWSEDELDEALDQRTRGAALVPEATGASLEAKDLVVRFRNGSLALDGTSLSLRPGHVLGIVGRNGSGKTTLARCLCGLQRERAGRLLLGGTELAPRRRCDRSHLVMQEPGYQLFEDSVLAELTQAQLQGERGKARTQEAEGRALELMDALRIGPLAARHPLSLSGGERQRVSVAAGMLCPGEVMVLDEPTSGLDFDGMRRIAEQLDVMRGSGRCVAVISHDLELLARVCDEAVEMEAGRAGPPLPLCASTLPRLRQSLGFHSHERL